MEKKIRFAILSQGDTLEKWQAEAIQQLIRSDNASLELALVNVTSPSSRRARNWSQLIGNKQLWRTFLWLNKKRISSGIPVAIETLIQSESILPMQTSSTKRNTLQLDGQQAATLKNLDLDFILVFGKRTIPAEFHRLTKYGVWAFQFGNPRKYRGGPAAFWEIYNNDAVTMASLVRLSPNKDQVQILKQGVLKTIYSFARNRQQILNEALRWPAMICGDIRREELKVFENQPIILSGNFQHQPDNFQFISYLFLVNFFHLKKILHQFFYIDFWNVGLVKGHISEFLKEDKPKVEWFPVENNRVFIADPFAWPDPNQNSRLHMFFETYSFKKRKGYIEYACYDSGFGKPVMVIEEPTHMSYPYLISENNEVLISTENFENSTVQIYRPTSFPLKWEKGGILFNQFPAIDSTIFQWQGSYWMFNSDRKDGVHHNLNLFYSDQFSGPWIPHPQNPVKTDIRSARCAGTPFIHEGYLFRPSMDYSEKKQGRVVLNKITNMSKTSFEEISVKTIYPYSDSKYPDKMHTLSAAGNYTLIDGAREAFILSDPIFIKYKFDAILAKLAIFKRLKALFNKQVKLRSMKQVIPPVSPSNLVRG